LAEMQRKPKRREERWAVEAIRGAFQLVAMPASIPALTATVSPGRPTDQPLDHGKGPTAETCPMGGRDIETEYTLSWPTFDVAAKVDDVHAYNVKLARLARNKAEHGCCATNWQP